ncbi:MAG: hypothetical protein Q9159_000103 [Coniocarpon cinnabarinum]
MVAPAFGFSVGDLATAVRLLNSIRKALRATDGAQNHFQHTIQRIENLVDILKCLQSLSGISSDLDPDRSIWKQASTCQQHLQDFVDSQEKFWKRLGPTTSPKWGLKTSWRKIEWSLSAAKDVEKLWQDVRQDMDTIQLAVSLHGIKSFAVAHRKQLALLHTLSTSSAQGVIEKEAAERNRLIKAASPGLNWDVGSHAWVGAGANVVEGPQRLEHVPYAQINGNIGPGALVSVK